MERMLQTKKGFKNESDNSSSVKKMQQMNREEI